MRPIKEYALTSFNKYSPFDCAFGYALNEISKKGTSFEKGIVTYLLYYSDKYKNEEDIPVLRSRVEEISKSKMYFNLSYMSLTNNYKELEGLFDEGLKSFARSGKDELFCWVGIVVNKYYRYTLNNKSKLSRTYLLGAEKIRIIFFIAEHFLKARESVSLSFSLKEIKECAIAQGYGVATVRVTF